MRIAFKIGPILERTGLALVDVHGHQTRALFRTHDAPFAPCGKACTAKAPQAGIFHGFDDGLYVVPTSDAGFE